MRHYFINTSEKFSPEIMYTCNTDMSMKGPVLKEHRVFSVFKRICTLIFVYRIAVYATLNYDFSHVR